MLDAHKSTNPATSQSLDARQGRGSPHHPPKGRVVQHFTDTEPFCTMSLGPKKGKTRAEGPRQSPQIFPTDSAVSEQEHPLPPSTEPFTCSIPHQPLSRAPNGRSRACHCPLLRGPCPMPPSLPSACEEEELDLSAK